MELSSDSGCKFTSNMFVSVEWKVQMFAFLGVIDGLVSGLLSVTCMDMLELTFLFYFCI